MPGIDPKVVAERYNSLNIIIDADDTWHLATENEISTFIQEVCRLIPGFETKKVLNAGSAGNSYGLSETNITHVDVADKHISHLPNSVVASVEELPFDNGHFDVIICVGSVLNYCDPIRVFTEFSRVLGPGGYLILEFENSFTFELLFKNGFNNSAFFIETFFDAHGDKESIWYFSDSFVGNLFKKFGFEIERKKRFHIISPLIYRLTGNESRSASFIKYDKLLRRIPGINKFSSNVICLGKKQLSQ